MIELLTQTQDKLLIDFEKEIMIQTKLTKEQLDTMDMGDIERHMGIVAKDPAKRKSLYKFISIGRRRYNHNFVSNLINNCRVGVD